jgi:hypothetical protein
MATQPTRKRKVYWSLVAARNPSGAFSIKPLKPPVLASESGITKITARFKMMNCRVSVIRTAQSPPIMV